MFKETPLLLAIGVLDVVNRAEEVGAETFRVVEPYTLAGLLFLLVSYPASIWSGRWSAVSDSTERDDPVRPASSNGSATTSCSTSWTSTSAGRVRVADRAERLGQDHDPAAADDPGEGRRRHRSSRRRLPDPHAARRQARPGRRRTCASVRKRIGMVFQQFNLFPNMNVLQNITEAPIRVLGLSKVEAEAARARTAGAGRPGRQDRRPPGPAVRRPAAAGGDRPGAGDAARRAAARRGHLGAGPRTGRRGAAVLKEIAATPTSRCSASRTRCSSPGTSPTGC